MTNTLDLTRPMQAKGGGAVKIITTNGQEPYPIVGYFYGDLRPRCWTSDGAYYRSRDQYEQTLPVDSFDLINVPEPKRSGGVWVDILESGSGNPYSVSSTLGKMIHGDKVIARYSHKWTEGEGLEK